MSIAAKILRGLVRGYQLVVSPLFPPSCRYQPTCSSYALEALAKHGAFKGAWLTVKRVGSCHPWSEGGLDPVPDSDHKCGHHQGS